MLCLLAACSAAQAPPSAATSPIDGVALDGTRIAAVTPRADTGTWVWPPIVDSHVHLAYLPVADRLAAHGVGAVVDLAAPASTLGAASGIQVRAAGPMITSPGGYPLDSWGRDGYGIGCADAACVHATVAELATKGAALIKVPVDPGGLAPELVPVAVEAAHAKGLKVAVHALSDEAAARAAAAGADVLAHTPVEPLSDATVAAWRGRVVISTLAAFGGSASAVDNLRRLRAAGVTVLYGTDLGNLRDEGPSADEVELLHAAGLDDAAITDAMTTAPVAYWGFDLGLAPGREATFLVLDRDPRRDASALLAPRAVYVRGKQL